MLHKSEVPRLGAMLDGADAGSMQAKLRKCATVTCIYLACSWHADLSAHAVCSPLPVRVGITVIDKSDGCWSIYSWYACRVRHMFTYEYVVKYIAERVAQVPSALLGPLLALP